MTTLSPEQVNSARVLLRLAAANKEMLHEYLVATGVPIQEDLFFGILAATLADITWRPATAEAEVKEVRRERQNAMETALRLMGEIYMAKDVMALEAPIEPPPPRLPDAFKVYVAATVSTKSEEETEKT